MDRAEIVKIIAGYTSPSTGYAIASAILHLADQVSDAASALDSINTTLRKIEEKMPD